MKFNTKYFGEIDIDDSEIIDFEDGIPGFEYLHKFVVIKQEDMIIDWIQSVEEDITFPIINPFLVNDKYEFKIPDNTVDRLDITNYENIIVYTVVTIPDKIENMRTNLQAPIIINNKNKKAKQLILNDKYPLRYKIFEKVGE